MIRIDHVTFSYGEENENAGGVHDINLTVEDGQCVVLCGESGCGKTTITRLINGLIPHYYEGKMNGEVWVNGAKVSEQPLYDTAKTVGSVFQNPRSQFFNVDTTSEITFGCENLGQPEQSIRERLDKTIRDFRLEKLMGRNIFHLSGGEKQKIACAGVSIMEPDVLVMDEPSSNLDASSILDLRAILAFWKSQGKTIIVSEHRLYYLRGLADRFIYITGGKVEKDYSAAEFESLTEQQRAKLGLRTFILEDLLPPKALPQAGQQMELRNFCFAYKNEPETLHIRESKIPANRIVGIIGNNGAGKSTFSRCFCGLEKRCGEVIWNGRTYRPKDRLNTCYMVMQEVNHQLFTETVLDEVLISMEEENQEWAEEILAELDLIGFKDRHPMSLSGGQKQRVAIASAIASKRSILFFDEPTSGLDYKHMKEVANVLTHGAGMLFGMTAIIILMMAAIRSGNPWAIGSFAVYVVCMTLSYVTSTFYHASTRARQKRLLRRFDHGAIYLHIAGTYTPFTLLALRQEGYWGWSLFAVIWIAAVAGVWLSFRKMRKKDHLKTVCYLAMGWVVIIAFKPLLHVFRETGSMDVLYWLIGGGLFYTVGCLFFFLDKYKYMHPVWHFFVLGGSICHFISIYLLV